MKVGIANDHHSVDLKRAIINHLEQQNIECIDYGSDGKEMTDYPLYAKLIGEAVTKKEIDYGILLCRTGIGMSIACNKIKGARCAKVSTEEEAVLTRADNDANVITLSELTEPKTAFKIVDAFLNTKFDDIERRIRRLKEIEDLEKL